MNEFYVWFMELATGWLTDWIEGSVHFIGFGMDG